MELPLRILELDGHPVNWTGHTRDISSGGVSFAIHDKLMVRGTAVTYLITLTASSPPVQIRCFGKVLRCRKTKGGGREAAIGMERYSFVRQEEVKLEVADASPDGGETIKELRRPALSRAGAG